MMHLSSSVLTLGALAGIGCGALLGFIVISYDGGSTALPPLQEGKISIMLTDDGYVPRDVRITRGSIVEFSTTRDRPHWPASNLHPDHSIYSEFDPKRPLEPAEVWSFTFDRPGVWNYHDHIRSYFTGRIYVE